MDGWMERSACIDKRVKGHSPGHFCFVTQQACSSMKLRGRKTTGESLF